MKETCSDVSSMEDWQGGGREGGVAYFLPYVE